MRGSFDQAGVFSAREQWTTRSGRRARHGVWREQGQAGSVRRQLLLQPGHHAGAGTLDRPSLNQVAMRVNQLTRVPMQSTLSEAIAEKWDPLTMESL